MYVRHLKIYWTAISYQTIVTLHSTTDMISLCTVIKIELGSFLSYFFFFLMKTKVLLRVTNKYYRKKEIARSYKCKSLRIREEMMKVKKEMKERNNRI